MGRIEVSGDEGLPKTRFTGGDALRSRLGADWDGWLAAGQEHAGEPERLAELLGAIDADAAVNERNAALRRDAAKAWQAYRGPRPSRRSGRI